MTKIILKELSFKVNGLLFEVHNELGRYCREKQYCDLLESKLKSEKIAYEREKDLPIKGIGNKFTNKADFVINDELLVEYKAKPIVTKEDYYQTQRYLITSGLSLGLIVNFRNKYIRPTRVIRHGS